MLKKIISFPLYYILSFLKLLFKRDTIILGTSSYHRYAGNTRYLYDFLCKNTEYKVFWLTESKKIMDHLDLNGLSYLSNKNMIKKVYYTLKCKIVIDSGTGYYDLFNLLSRDNKVVKISTMHGSGPKLSVERSHDIDKSIKLIKKVNTFNCVSFCTEYSQRVIGVNQLFLPLSKTKIFGLPKIDLLVDSNYINHIKAKKKWTKKILNLNETDNSKIIYYAPTFRSKSSELPIFTLRDFDINKFNDFLASNNIYFIYTYHSMSNFISPIVNLSHIKYYGITKDPLFDNMELMIESDMMVGDYSTLSTEFSILNKPQLFIINDYDDVNNTKGFAENLRDTLPGEEINCYDQFKNTISYAFSNPSCYLEKYQSKINLLQKRYVGNLKSSSRERFKSYIDTIMMQ